jgi:hypothetical protein
MKLMTTSVTALAAFGMLAGAGASATACEFHKSHVTAAVAPPVTQEDVAAPATTVDPVLLAEARAAMVPVAPKEESIEATETD